MWLFRSLLSVLLLPSSHSPYHVVINVHHRYVVDETSGFFPDTVWDHISVLGFFSFLFFFYFLFYLLFHVSSCSSTASLSSFFSVSTAPPCFRYLLLLVSFVQVSLSLSLSLSFSLLDLFLHLSRGIKLCEVLPEETS